MRPPAGRRATGDPPFTWEQSATDALKSQQLHVKSDWSLPAVLFRLEAYNGWATASKGWRRPTSEPPIATPPVSTADGRFDLAAVSDQCGAAVILKRLEQRGEVQLQGMNQVEAAPTNGILVAMTVRKNWMLASAGWLAMKTNGAAT